MASILEQIDAALTSADDADAVRVWVWLRLFGGECFVSEMLASGIPNVVPGANKLIANSRIKTTGGKIQILPFIDHVKKAREAKPKATTSPAQKRKAEVWVFDSYNAVRIAKGVRPLPEEQRRRRRTSEALLMLAEFLEKNEVEAKKYIEFAFEKSRWQKTQFPAIAFCAGPWLQGEWEDHDQGAVRDHAGHSYEKPVGLKDALIEAGHTAASDLNEAGIRNIAKRANTHRTNPGMRTPHPVESTEEMIRWTAKNWSK